MSTGPLGRREGYPETSLAAVAGGGARKPRALEEAWVSLISSSDTVPGWSAGMRPRKCRRGVRTAFLTTGGGTGGRGRGGSLGGGEGEGEGEEPRRWRQAALRYF